MPMDFIFSPASNGISVVRPSRRSKISGGRRGANHAGRFGEEEKRGLPLSGASSPAPLRTFKAHLPSRAKQRLQGLYPLLRASSADLKRTVQALQLK